MTMQQGAPVLRLTSQCATREEFATFLNRLCDGTTVSIPSNRAQAVGITQRFCITLADGVPVFTGTGLVLGVHNGHDNQLPSVELEILSLDEGRELLEAPDDLADQFPRLVELEDDDDATVIDAAPPHLEGMTATPTAPPKAARALAPPNWRPVESPSPPPRVPQARLQGTAPLTPMPQAPPQPPPTAPPTPFASPLEITGHETSVPAGSHDSSQMATPVPSAPLTPPPGFPPRSGEHAAAGGAGAASWNPLGELDDSALEGFVECTLSEHSGPQPVFEAEPPVWNPYQSQPQPTRAEALVPPWGVDPRTTAEQQRVTGTAAATRGPRTTRLVLVILMIIALTAAGALSLGLFIGTSTPDKTVAQAETDPSANAAPSGSKSTPPEKEREPAKELGNSTEDGAKATADDDAKATADDDAKATADDAAGASGDAAKATADDAAKATADDAAKVTGENTDKATNPPPPDTAVDTKQCAISVTGQPRHAKVYAGKKLLGTAPLETPVDCGTVKLRIASSRFASQTKTVVADPQKPAQVKFRLDRLTTKLRILSAPPGAKVRVMGRVAGKTPLTVKVPAFARPTISIELDGYKRWSRRVRVGGKPDTVKAMLWPGK